MCNIEKYKIIRSCRRTIAIIIERDGSVIVRAPNYAEKSEIDRFVSSKEEWIRKKSRDCFHYIKQPSTPHYALRIRMDYPSASHSVFCMLQCAKLARVPSLASLAQQALIISITTVYFHSQGQKTSVISQ